MPKTNPRMGRWAKGLFVGLACMLVAVASVLAHGPAPKPKARQWQILPRTASFFGRIALVNATGFSGTPHKPAIWPGVAFRNAPAPQLRPHWLPAPPRPARPEPSLRLCRGLRVRPSGLVIGQKTTLGVYALEHAPNARVPQTTRGNAPNTGQSPAQTRIATASADGYAQAATSASKAADDTNTETNLGTGFDIRNMLRLDPVAQWMRAMPQQLPGIRVVVRF